LRCISIRSGTFAFFSHEQCIDKIENKSKHKFGENAIIVFNSAQNYVLDNNFPQKLNDLPMKFNIIF